MDIHLGLRWWIFDPNPALRVQVRTASEFVYGLLSSAGNFWKRSVVDPIDDITHHRRELHLPTAKTIS